MLKENLNGFLDEITEKIEDENISTGVPLSRFSTYRVGGPAALLIKVEDTSVFSLLVKALKKFHLPILLIGNGSNLLISDDVFEGAVLKLGESFETIEIEGEVVKAGAAVKLPVLARETVKFGLSGFEWAVGVPGTVGGAVRMNAGGHGSDIASSLLEVTTINLLTGVSTNVPAKAMDFSYRYSCI